MRKILFLCVCYMFCTFSLYAQDGNVIEWKFGHNADTEHIWHQTAVKFAEEIKRKSNGRMIVKIYPNGELGKESNVVEGIAKGIYDMALTTEALAAKAPKAALMAVPYAIRDYGHMEKVINGPVGIEIKDDMIRNTGLLPLYYHERPPRNLTSNTVIKNVNDLKGLKIRISNTPVFVKTWEHLGAVVSTIAFKDVYAALKSNAIQGQENPNDITYGLKYYEVQKYLYETEYVFQWIYASVGVKQFEKLPFELQSIVIESAGIAEAFAAEKFRNYNIKVRKELESKGIKIMPVNKAEFKDKLLPDLPKILTPDQYRLYTEIQKINY